MSNRPFRAFVSYSHVDRAFAARLQRRLEAYRLPKRLADRVEPLPGQARGRIGPVFRDRVDLTATENLPAAVRQAIADSSALVVVASPDAALSQWVALEIRLFREIHPAAPVLVALIRGEVAEAMPPALQTTGAEPLAADFRRVGDGKRLAFLKIVAALAALPLDALVQRDSQRQVRRVTAVTLGAVAMLVVLGGLLVMALQARVEAERQRTDAEGLVEYMLTDLRQKLRGVGRPEVMVSVNARAMEHYRQADLVRLSDEGLDRRARILHAMGEDEEALGSPKAAVEQFLEAHRTTAAILARHPGDADAIYAHAQSEFWVGDAAFQSEDLPRAREHWGRYLFQARALARVAPGSTRSLLELGYAHGNLCDVNMRDRFDLVSAEKDCRSALALARSALKQDARSTSLRRAVANRLGRLADVLLVTNQLREARALRLDESALIKALLVEDPRNVDLRDRLVWPQIGLGKIEIAEGSVAAGVARLKDSVRQLDAISAEIPASRTIIGERVRAGILAAQALRNSGDSEWRGYRDRAAALLEASTSGRPMPGQRRFQRMLGYLDAGKEIK